MAKKSQRQKQQKAMKKRRKDKARRRSAQQQSNISSARLIKSARKYSILGCWIDERWDKADNEGMVRILIAREIDATHVVVGTYMIDLYLLGVKDTTAFWDMPISELHGEVLPFLFRDDDYIECSPELAHQIIYESIDFAKQYRFSPHSDFKTTKFILEPRGTYPEEHTVPLGKDGKPFYVPVPYDNTSPILRKLETYAGEGNFEYMHPLAEMLSFLPEDDDDRDDDWQDEDDEDNA